MKSWISFLLPNDEYKEKMMLYFYCEGALLLLLSLIAMIIYNNYFDITVVNALLLSLAIFLFYVSIRYVVSGIEYTDVTTTKAYKKELKIIAVRIAVFFISLILGYLIFAGPEKWFEILWLTLSVSLSWFVASFTSLKRSYNKNKDLL
ncbi:hypothetical protein ACW2QC_18045 [Virgibacillus sp. FSP13]